MVSVPFDRFTEGARWTLVYTQEEAQRLGHRELGTAHLLLGLLRQGDGVGARVLRELGVALRPAREAVMAVVGPGEELVWGEITLSPRTRRVLELGVEEAQRRQHPSIDTGHLLLGLTGAGEGTAARVLRGLGVEPERVRARVVQMLSPGADDAPDTP